MFSDGKCRIEFDPTITDPSKIAGKIFILTYPAGSTKLEMLFDLFVTFRKLSIIRYDT